MPSASGEAVLRPVGLQICKYDRRNADTCIRGLSEIANALRLFYANQFQLQAWPLL